MKHKHNKFRFTVTAFLFAVFISFTYLLPPVLAQEENLETETPTPSETPSIPEATPEPLEIPEIESESGFQSFSLQSSAELGGDWAAQVNISDTEGESFKPQIAADGFGNLHIVWRETVNGNQEIFYTWIDVDKTAQSLPLNVSNSPTFHSHAPQIVVDSTGIAHIVWQETDNDHGDDYEIHYSNCQTSGNEGDGYISSCSTTPTILSNGDACGSFVGDWKSTDPSIGIDGNDNLMVAWMSFEPSNRLYTMFSLWSASGNPPASRTGCNLATGSYYYPVVAGDSNGDFHLLRMNASTSIFYSKYSGGSWSANQTLGTGWLPVIHVDVNNKLHAAWWNTNTPPKYKSKESTSSTWSSTENIFASTICTDISLITDDDNLPRLVCANGPVYEASRQTSGWTESVIIQSAGSQPDLIKDSSNNLHLVWSDSRSGVLDIFYSPTYSCEGISPQTTAGLAVLNEIQNMPFLNYCKNLVEEVIYVPALDGQNDPNEAFQEWADLIRSAKYEVAFTVMFWDRRSVTPYPDQKILESIENLYFNVKNQAHMYPHGMKVRILLGVQRNIQDLPLPLWPDQRYSVLDALKDQGENGIPIYELLSNGKAWKVEVAMYRDGEQVSTPPGIYSHVKLMIVDSNKIIISGYHPQYGFRTIGTESASHDLGIKVLGPVATNGMTVFDSLWEGSEILCTKEDVEISIWSFCHRAIAENPTHWFFVPQGNDIVLPLYRDHDDKWADNAVETAIESAAEKVYVIQNRFGVPGNEDVQLYWTDGWLNYATAILNKALENKDVRILISKTDPNLSQYNIPSVTNFMSEYRQNGGQKDEEDMIRFYHPTEYPADSPPGLHTKAFMVDENFLVIGSQNFDHSAFGDNDNDLDLVEYSVGIENDTIIENFITDSEINSIWDNSGKLSIIAPNESLSAGIQQASAKDVIVLEAGTYEISSTLNIPEGITLVGLDAIIIPAQNFSSESTFKLASPSLQTTPAPLLRITGDNVSLIGLTLQDSSGYAIEVEDGVENAYISNIVFENNALGGVHVSGNTTYTVENNTFIAGGSGVTIASNVNATGLIRNNIFTEQTIAPIEITSTDDGEVEYSYNLFDECDLGTCSLYWHIGDLSASSNAHDNLFDLDPSFVNPSNGEYQLLANSPAIDAGDPSILHEFLFDGDENDELRIDIGAHEYMGELSNEPTPTPTPTQTPSETPTPTVTPTFTPSPTFTPVSDLIFADSFESGNFNAWGWATTNGGDLSVSTQSSAVGTYGMQALINDNAELVVYDHTPNNETHYSARFYFDPNDVQSPNDGFYLTALSSTGAGWVACLLFEPQGNDYYSLNLCGKNDAGNWLETESVLIADEWQAVELEWKAATSAGANNGYIKLYIGDELAASIENIDNDTHSITTTSLGILDTPTGASGTVYFDEFESHTGSHIGLHPNAPSVNPAPALPDALFADNFESNNLNAWNLALTKIDFGDLFTSSGSAYQSNYGLQALIDDTVVLKAIDSSPADESQYRARFYFHPNSLTMNNNTAHYIFDGYDTDVDEYLFRLELLYEGGSYKIRPRIMKDSFSTITGSKYTISNAWHLIEIDWKKSTMVGANNGYLSLWIDGTLVGTIANVDNDLWTLDFVQLGATASIDSTTSGSMWFDNFISRRFTYIGQ